MVKVYVMGHFGGVCEARLRLPVPTQEMESGKAADCFGNGDMSIFDAAAVSVVVIIKPF